MLLAPTLMGLAAMPALFLMLGLADMRMTDIGAPLWYRRLRLLLTTIVVIALLRPPAARSGEDQSGASRRRPTE